MAKLSKANASLLASIVAAMAVQAKPYALHTIVEIAALAKEGLVETNDDPTLAEGDKVAVRATDKGIAVNLENNPPAAGAGAALPAAAGVQTVTPAASGFIMGEGFVPSKARGGKGRTLYDFDNMPVGGYIFVPATAEKPTPAKSLASTVSSASKRSAPKKFGVQSVEAGQVNGTFTAPADGAVIYREADVLPATA